jgi:hypothetical protein
MLIICHYCGLPIKRNLRRAEGLLGTLTSYHRICLERREEARRRDAGWLAAYQASRVDRLDDRRLVK